MRLSAPGALLLAAVPLLPPSSASAGGPSGWPNVAPHVAPALRGVLKEAATRLATPGCAALLHDFVDSRTGRPLADTLAATGLDAEGWLGSLHCLNGNGRTGCVSGRTLADTPVGSPVVWVCPLGLEKPRTSTCGRSASVLIHEALHTLGLTKGPPSPEEITLRVRIRCGNCRQGADPGRAVRGPVASAPSGRGCGRSRGSRRSRARRGPKRRPGRAPRLAPRR